jgi:hypothetical protein
MNESSESEPSIKRANIHDRVARLLAAASKLEFDNIDMEKILSTQKRPYRCVKRPETTDTENSSDSSESVITGISYSSASKYQ